MGERAIKREIKYEAELYRDFPSEIASIPGNEKLWNCIQCGTCSGTCPLSIYMDYTPRRVIAMTRAGFKDEVLNSNTIWLCASCYSCTVECPKEIKITDIMYALKRRAIQDGVYRRRFAIPVMARQFFRAVLKHGRNTESRLLVRTYLRSSPWRLLKNAGLAMRLWSRGRMGLGVESVRDKSELKRLLDAVGGDNGNGVPSRGKHK